jgi:glycosyltransferase involved in cell wall biosynthesis
MKNKKIICFIDSFSSGGAQKQMVMLANGLSKVYDVKTLQYHDLNFFADKLDPTITQNKIIIKNKLSRIISIIYYFYKENPDTIISFLAGPCNYTALYKMLFFWRKTKFIVGERNLNIGEIKFKDLLIRFSHIFADVIICNSNAQKEKLKSYFSRKIHFIPNGTNAPNIELKKYESNNFTVNKKLIVPARFIDQKNPLNLLKALNKVEGITIYWYGELFKNYEIYDVCMKYIETNNLNNKFVLMPVNNNIYNEMIKYDALILPSFYEGCPNAIIDAMYCGLVVLASNVSDNAIYLNHQKELLFNPYSVEDIVSKLNYFQTLEIEKCNEIGKENIQKANDFFNPEEMISSYLKFIK